MQTLINAFSSEWMLTPTEKVELHLKVRDGIKEMQKK